MSAVALLKFRAHVQGGDGEALNAEDVSYPVIIENVSNTDVRSWRIELLYGPPGTPFEQTPGTPLLLAENADDTTPTYTFDTHGTRLGFLFRIRLKVWPATGFGGVPSEDIRCFGVPKVTKMGAGAPPMTVFFPPYQKLPDPLPLVAEDPVRGRPDELNFGGQAFGWSGGHVVYPVLLNHLLDALSDGNNVPAGTKLGQILYWDTLNTRWTISAATDVAEQDILSWDPVSSKWGPPRPFPLYDPLVRWQASPSTTGQDFSAKGHIGFTFAARTHVPYAEFEYGYFLNFDASLIDGLAYDDGLDIVIRLEADVVGHEVGIDYLFTFKVKALVIRSSGVWTCTPLIDDFDGSPPLSASPDCPIEPWVSIEDVDEDNFRIGFSSKSYNSYPLHLQCFGTINVLGFTPAGT